MRLVLLIAAVAMMTITITVIDTHVCIVKDVAVWGCYLLITAVYYWTYQGRVMGVCEASGGDHRGSVNGLWICGRTHGVLSI